MGVMPGPPQTSVVIVISWPVGYILLPRQMPLPTVLIDASSEPRVGDTFPVRPLSKMQRGRTHKCHPCPGLNWDSWLYVVVGLNFFYRWGIMDPTPLALKRGNGVQMAVHDVGYGVIFLPAGPAACPLGLR